MWNASCFGTQPTIFQTIARNSLLESLVQGKGTDCRDRSNRQTTTDFPRLMHLSVPRANSSQTKSLPKEWRSFQSVNNDPGIRSGLSAPIALHGYLQLSSLVAEFVRNKNRQRCKTISRTRSDSENSQISYDCTTFSGQSKIVNSRLKGSYLSSQAIGYWKTPGVLTTIIGFVYVETARYRYLSSLSLNFSSYTQEYNSRI